MHKIKEIFKKIKSHCTFITKIGLAEYLNYTAGTTKANKISKNVRTKKLKTHRKKRHGIKKKILKGNPSS